MYIYQIMNNNFGFIDIILLGMIAGFIILRLRNILGRKTGHGGKSQGEFDNKVKNLEPEINTSLPLKEAKDDYDKKVFLEGAEIAYESILTSFAKGEKKKLKSLLTPNMVLNFDEAIAVRNKDNIKSEFTFIGVKNSNVEKYEKIKNDIFASVKFVSEVISVKKDKDNKIIEGNPDKIKQVIDRWKFTKNILNKSPNWYLSEIISK
jgi:predicted lipid-binding transport protein (Tim44 family)